MTYRKERDRNLYVAGRWSWMSLLGFACIKSGCALVRPDRQMFQSEKKAIFPFIRFGLFDPEGLGAATGLGVSPAR
ncbi:DNA helicase [Rossellomorea aquimaris]|uniref:DNA helicase n=1 Tax=Rossellomorea TaxID=2837508 RepID=UPI0016535BD3|nr:DNA helicase [Rossellomorea aquimaris]